MSQSVFVGLNPMNAPNRKKGLERKLNEIVNVKRSKQEQLDMLKKQLAMMQTHYE